MTTSLKDVSSAQMVYTLNEMNCFETECTVYGYVWKDRNGRKQYTTSEDHLIIHQSFEEKELLGYVMSPIRSLSIRLIMKEETKDDSIFLQKLRWSKTLQQCYNDDYFRILEKLCGVANDNRAFDMLYQWQCMIEGYYDADMVKLFEGAVIEAYKIKHLTRDTYQKFCRWIQLSKKQISQQGHRVDHFSRIFYGVAYEKSKNDFKYLCNANKQSLFDRLLEFDAKDIFYTPIFEKEYVYHRSNDLKDIRKMFENHLRTIMDDSYLQSMKAIKAFPFNRDEDIACKCLDEAKCICTEEAANGVAYWAHRWNMI